MVKYTLLSYYMEDDSRLSLEFRKVGNGYVIF